MKIRIAIGVLAAAGLLGAEEPPKAVPLLDLEEVVPEDQALASEFQPPQIDPGIELKARSISGSRQFIVSGGDTVQRASLAMEAEAVRGRFYQTLGKPGVEVTMPIEILLHGEVGDEPRTRPLAYELRFTAETFLLRIHVDLARGIDHERMARAVISGLLYQTGLSEVEPGALDSPISVPAWLVEGLREAARWSEGNGDRKLYESVFKQEELFDLDELLVLDERDRERLDGATRVGFRVLSGALVMALLEQPGGRESFAGFCEEVATFDGDLPILLRQYFPGLNLSEQSLAKWWALTLARLADAPLTEVLGIAETERSLEDTLALHFRDEKGIMTRMSFSEPKRLEELEGEVRRDAIRPAQEALERLSYRCFPSYRPLILEYQQALSAWVADDDFDDLEALAADLLETREIMSGRARRARDYLDFMEIAGATELSGGFTDYMALKRELEERPRPERDDPISRHLDRLEKVYSSAKGR